MVLLAVIALGWQSFSLHSQTREILYTELRDIRSEMGEMRSDMNERFAQVNERLARLEALSDSEKPIR